MSWRTAKDWWKAPVLQGPENDYGEYDYMIEDIPDNFMQWRYEDYPYKCDCCGRYRRFMRETYAYFYTMDGYDYANTCECWRCIVKAKIWSRSYQVKKFFKRVKDDFKIAHELNKASKSTIGFLECYKKVKEWR